MPADAPRKPVSLAWPAVAVVIMALLAIIGWLLFRTAGAPATGSSPSNSPSPSATAPDAAQPVPGVNGCLGGEDASVAIYAAMKAPLTKAGAVNFLATVLRWSTLWPKPAGQQSQIGPKVLSANMLQQLSQEKIPQGSKLWADTTGAVYKVTAFSDESATIAMVMESAGTYQGQQTTATNAAVYGMTVHDGHWLLSSSDPVVPGAHNPRKNIAAVKDGGSKLPDGCA